VMIWACWCGWCLLAKQPRHCTVPFIRLNLRLVPWHLPGDSLHACIVWAACLPAWPSMDWDTCSCELSGDRLH
jgi:hypothetical protein